MPRVVTAAWITSLTLVVLGKEAVKSPFGVAISSVTSSTAMLNLLCPQAVSRWPSHIRMTSSRYSILRWPRAVKLEWDEDIPNQEIATMTDVYEQISKKIRELRIN